MKIKLILTNSFISIWFGGFFKDFLLLYLQIYSDVNSYNIYEWILLFKYLWTIVGLCFWSSVEIFTVGTLDKEIRPIFAVMYKHRLNVVPIGCAGHESTARHECMLHVWTMTRSLHDINEQQFVRVKYILFLPADKEANNVVVVRHVFYTDHVCISFVLVMFALICKWNGYINV